jgi:hypothetical protein
MSLGAGVYMLMLDLRLGLPSYALLEFYLKSGVLIQVLMPADLTAEHEEMLKWLNRNGLLA